MEYQVKDGNLILHIPGFSLIDSLDCGQCFRFEQQPDGRVCGMAGNHFLSAYQQGDQIIFEHMTEQEFETFWKDYLDLDTDYQEIQKVICQDKTVAAACEYAGGIHILRQDSWEALCSFILSQNNNIPRIKGIISRLCENFGEKTEYGYAFPTIQQLSQCKLEDLSVLRAGFRAKYLLDAIQKINSGEVDLERVRTADFPQAKEELLKICGVGTKVADCALLFGFYRLESFPIDVWMKRVMQYFYPNGFPEYAKPYAGIAQQYLFHYIRTCPDQIPEEVRKKQKNAG